MLKNCSIYFLPVLVHQGFLLAHEHNGKLLRKVLSVDAESSASAEFTAGTGIPLSCHVARFPLLPPLLFTAVFALSGSRRVARCGINGCVQLCGVKQVVKGSYTILFQQGQNL